VNLDFLQLLPREVGTFAIGGPVPEPLLSVAAHALGRVVTIPARNHLPRLARLRGLKSQVLISLRVSGSGLHFLQNPTNSAIEDLSDILKFN
jgi:hypothetical protein